MAATTLIRNVSVLWGPDLALVERTTLAIEGRRVAGLDGGAAPAGAETVDGGGLLLVPGFVDAHVHIGFADPAEVLRRGVTTVRDLGWPPEEIFPLARASEQPGFAGPLIRAVGPIHTASGGYPTQASWAPAGTGCEVAGESDAKAAVRRLDMGAAAVKFALNPPVGPVLDHDTLRGLVDAAHAAGLRATGHVYGLAELQKALDCGVDELAHMLMSEEEIPDAVIVRMAGAGMTVVPTLSIRFGRDRELAIDNLARFRAAGGRVVYGTDLGNEGPGPGIDRTEVTAMTAAGFDSLGVVAAATVDAARHLGLDSKGVLGDGMDADVVAVPLDALERPELLSDVKMVWREGGRAS
ncbi:MAG TPA: amidohydrolase family protein [Actinomycetota bacterium]|nr:amidohydrolase family protein [Actinomycetota bacterium]